MARKDICFNSHGVQCAGWFYRAEAQGDRPCVVMAHGLGGIKEMRLDAYAERFAAAGYNVLVFDYRYFGASGGEPRQLLDIRSQLQDWTAAIEHARGLPGVDPQAIVLWGSSLSGGHVIAVAAGDARIAAVIAQVPHLSGIASMRVAGPSAIAALTLHGVYDLLRRGIGMRPHYVLSSAEPGQRALMNAPGESAGYLNLVPEGTYFDRRVAAGFALRIAWYSPGRALPKLPMPSLIQVGLNDVTTPAGPAIALCRRAPKATIKKYSAGHFQPYVEPLFATVIQDQLDFLQRRFRSGVATRSTSKVTS